jgi:TPR repeat protein
MGRRRITSVLLLFLVVGYMRAQDENVLQQAQHGDGHAQRELASYFFGRKDYRSALHWTSLWLNSGTVGNFPGDAEDYGQAVIFARKGAEQSDSECEYDLGLLYLLGLGVPRDATQAAVWFHKAADRGNADAETRLGSLYLDGIGVPEDDSRALSWYLKAADQGNANAETLLGILIKHGQIIWNEQSSASGLFACSEFVPKSGRPG